MSFKSCHPRHTKVAIPYSQALRYRRICSDDRDLDHHLNNLEQTFVDRQFPPKLVRDALDKARRKNRQDLFRKSTAEKSTRINLTVSFGSNIPKVNNILKRHYSILTQSDRMKEIFHEPPRVAYRRARSLQDDLVNSKINKPVEIPKGCHPCNGRRCQICKLMQCTQTLKSTNSNFFIKINADLDCNSSNVIYVIQCNTCQAQYVGQTKSSFRIRFNNHKSDVLKKPNLPVSRHFRQDGHSINDVSVFLVQSNFKSDRNREQRESYLIYKFRSSINEDPGILSTIRSLTT